VVSAVSLGALAIQSVGAEWTCKKSVSAYQWFGSLLLQYR
jgi:hypothetical protein